MTLSDAPVLGKPIQLIYTFWPNKNIKWDSLGPEGSISAKANVTLSNRFELLGGALQWEGHLNEQSKIELRATIKAVRKGTCEIVAGTSVMTPQGSIGGGSNVLYALILTDRGFSSEKPEDLPGGNVPILYNIPTTDEIVIQPRLSLENPPSLGETAELALVAEAMMDASGARISVVLPKEVELVGGDLQWNGDMIKGDEIELKAVIKATKVGKWVIQTSSAYSPNLTTLKYLPSNYLALYVFKDGADTVEGPPIKALPQVNMELSFSNLPPLHKQVELTCQVVAVNDDLQKARIGINWRTSGFQLISGNPDWEGNMKQGIPIELQIVLEPEVTGTLELMTSVSAFDEDRELYSYVTDKWIYVQVTEDSASLVPPPTRIAPSPVPVK